MEYTEENIKKLEDVYKIMISLHNVQDGQEKETKLKAAGKLLQEVGLVKDPNDTREIATTYNKHLLKRIREYVKKSQAEVKRNG